MRRWRETSFEEVWSGLVDLYCVTPDTNLRKKDKYKRRKDWRTRSNCGSIREQERGSGEKHHLKRCEAVWWICIASRRWLRGCTGKTWTREHASGYWAKINHPASKRIQFPNKSSSPFFQTLRFLPTEQKSIKLLQNALRVSNEESLTLCLNDSVLSPCFKILRLAEQDSIILLQNVAIFPVFWVILWLKRSVCSCARAHNSRHWLSAINLYNRQLYYRKGMHVLLGA